MTIEEMIKELKHLAHVKGFSRVQWLADAGIRNTYFSTITNTPSLASMGKYEKLAAALGYRIEVEFKLVPVNHQEKDLLVANNARVVGDVEGMG